MNGYLYKITHVPTGYMYFGSRKTPEGVSPDADEYMGSPKGTNKMLDLYSINPIEEFKKEILTVMPYEEILELETLLIGESWDKFGKVSEGGLVTNLNVGGAVVFTDEVKAKMSKSRMGVAPWNKGKSYSNIALRGCKLSPEHREKLSIARMGKSPWNKGKRGLQGHGRKVTNTMTGEVWRTGWDADRALGLGKGCTFMRIKKAAFGGIWQYLEDAA